MRKTISLAAGLLLSLAAMTLALEAVAEGAAPAGGTTSKLYVCGRCGLPCDTLVFHAPGTCPRCGMALVEQRSQKAAPDTRRKVAILVFNGVEIIDYSGPYEVFGAAGCDVFTVGLTTAPVTTAMGLVVVPKYSFANAPAPDLLVVPGGGIAEAMNSEPTLNWIKDVTARDVHTLSVCNGAFFLARAGLLDGLSATTTAGNIDRLATQYPRVHVVRDQRFVDNGKIITAAGLSAGIDGALHAVERMMGAGDAQAVALGLEYPWISNGGFARASMADEEVPNLDLDTIGNWDWVRTEGDRSRWDMELRATSPLTAAEITDRVGRQLIERGKWVRTGTSGDDSSRTTRWKFTGRDGAAWTAATVVTGVAGADHHYGLKLSLGRAPSSR